MGKQNESKVDYWLTEDGLLLLEAWSRDGLSLQDIADHIGVQRYTLSTWRKKYPEIEAALQIGKELVDYRVENAILKAALGYQTKEIKVTIGKKVLNGETFELLKETTTREVAPNVAAGIFWLNNRKYEQWKRNKDKTLELSEEDSNISISIIRGPSPQGGVNQEVNIHPKTDAERKQELKDQEDEEAWEDWDEEEDFDE